MRQFKLKGFTLIELLIVVAIIAILAAIAVPNFLEAQIRSKVSKAKSDMRTLATGLEAYFIDQNTYATSLVPFEDAIVTVNSGLKPDGVTTSKNNSPAGAWYRITFATYRPDVQDAQANSLTTPVAYLTSLSPDPFADTHGSAFGYYNAKDAGWIAWSYGPDTDEQKAAGSDYNGQIQAWLWKLAADVQDGTDTAALDNESVYNPYQTNPSSELLGGQNLNAEAYTYDSTNGSTSKGDVWRIKQ